MRNNNRLLIVLVGSFVAVSGAAVAPGATIDLYHLGESDPGAVAGNEGNTSTVDSGPAAQNLSRFMSPTYSSNVAAPGSTISMAFDGSSDYDSVHVPTTATTNVGVDAWIYPTVGNVTVGIAYNGNPGANGYGLYEVGPGNGFTAPSGYATVIALVGGVDYGPSVNVPLNTWSEVKQVLENGKDELFLNGTLIGSNTDTARTPAGNFELGHGFTGEIDEVSLFTVPEPGCISILALGCIGVLARRRRA